MTKPFPAKPFKSIAAGISPRQYYFVAFCIIVCYNTNMENIGEKIYSLRKEKGVSQEKLAEEVNVARQTVSKWERDIAQPTMENIKSLCVYFGADLNYFLSDEEIAEMARVTKNGGWIVCCDGDDGFRSTTPDRELISRGFEYFGYKTRQGGNAYNYRKLVRK